MIDAAPDCDVAVIGGGPAGATAALLLARAGHRVTLIDRETFPRDKACGDLIGSYAIGCLRRLGITLDVVDAALPLRGAFVFAPDGRHIGAMVSERVAARLGARVIPRFRFDAALVAAAVGAGATFRHARVTSINHDAAGSIHGVHTADGKDIRATITIGADGWSSLIARAIVTTPRAANDVGIAVRTYFDGLAAAPAMRFFIGATGNGYGWIFPMADRSANVGLGFIRDEPGAGNLHAAFTRFLDRPELRGGVERGARRSWPIPFGWRGTPASTAGALLVGDAASLASSLSGSGIHTAIASGALAAEVASTALSRGDVSARALREYDHRLRRIANRLRFERQLHAIAGTAAGSSTAIDIARRIPGTGRVAVRWLLNLG